MASEGYLSLGCDSTEPAHPCKSGRALQPRSRTAQDAQLALARSGDGLAARQLARGDDRLDREVVGSLDRKARPVRTEREQGVAGPHPHPVQGKKWPARRKGSLARRMPEELVQPAQRPGERQPFVDVA